MRSILIQLDPDPHPSAFDRVVAVDADVDELFSYGRVKVEDVENLVHGAMFTRGPDDLKRTAIFIGGSDVAAGEAILARVVKTFFGPLRVSVMMDANGSNTTAAAAVLAAGKHVALDGAEALVLGGTGPVGQRAARLLAREGAKVRLASRSGQRAADAADAVNKAVEQQQVTGVETFDDATTAQALEGVGVVIAAGAAGVRLLTRSIYEKSRTLKVLIDLNAVPPTGIEGVDITDKARSHGDIVCYGALGVGGTKMKIHKAAIRSLFESNDKILDAEAIYAIGKRI